MAYNPNDKKPAAIYADGGPRPVDKDDTVWIPTGCFSTLKGVFCLQNLNRAIKYKGEWDASVGYYPPDPEEGDWWIINVAGTIGSVEYDVNDWIVYDGSQWRKVDNTQEDASKSGSGPPISISPDFVGQIYYDILNDEPYVSHGSGIGDWTPLVGGSVLFNMLRAITADPNSDRVKVTAGYYRVSDASGIQSYAGGYSPIFPPRIFLPRIDLLVIDDNGDLGIIQGAENVLPTPPEYPCDRYVIAEIKITESVNVIVDEPDITDARDFIGPNKLSEIDCGSFI